MTGGKSSKQRRAELLEERKAKTNKRRKRFAEDVKALAIPKQRAPGTAEVKADALAPDGSYSVRDFIVRGYYEDKPFTCKDCGKVECWTATQQKWWYEVAKGGRWTEATRCRPCRRKERERAAEHRRVSEEGRQRKLQGKAKAPADQRLPDDVTRK